MDMDLIAPILIIAGGLIYCIGGILFLIAAFRQSIWWGLACLFLPIVQIFFLIVHWPEAKRPFFMQLTALVVVVIVILLNPHAIHH